MLTPDADGGGADKIRRHHAADRQAVTAFFRNV
jgi:hypothetical protein